MVETKDESIKILIWCYLTQKNAFIILFRPLLEARAKIFEKFRWFFGISEDKIICYRDLLTFSSSFTTTFKYSSKSWVDSRKLKKIMYRKLNWLLKKFERKGYKNSKHSLIFVPFREKNENRNMLWILATFRIMKKYILCNVCNGKTDSSLNFDIFGLEKATNQLQTPDKASYLDFSSGL